MNRIAVFEKVSYAQFNKDFKDAFNYFNDKEIKDIYDKIILPKRATKQSAGYDFFSPINFTLKPKETIKIPTGIRVKIEDSYVLCLFPRSSLGFKYRLQLNNTVGIIDADYYNSSNEGHIFIKMTNDSNDNKVVEIKSLDGFAQGIFFQFGICYDDKVETIRDGGIGSTSKKV